MPDTAPPPDTIKTNYPWTQRNEWPSGKYLAAYLAIGLSGGIISALFGIGGGAYIVPLLSGWLHVPLRRAVGISIAVVLGIVMVGVVSESLATSNIIWLLAGVLALGAQIGVRFGGWVGSRISSEVLRYIYIVFLVLIAMKLGRIIPGDATLGVLSPSQIHTAWVLALFPVGVLAGFLSVLLGIGGGTVAVPLMLLLINGLPFQSARATSLAMVLPTAFAGVWVHVRQKNILWRSAIPIMVPGFVGAIVGVMLANVIPGEVLRHYVFPVFLTIMAIRLLVKGDH